MELLSFCDPDSQQAQQQPIHSESTASTSSVFDFPNDEKHEEEKQEAIPTILHHQKVDITNPFNSEYFPFNSATQMEFYSLPWLPSTEASYQMNAWFVLY